MKIDDCGGNDDDNKIISVVLPLPFDKTFDYFVEGQGCELVSKGSVVKVPFGRRELIGIVINDNVQSPSVKREKLKRVIKIYPYMVPAKLIKIFNWLASYTISPLGLVYKMLINKAFGDMLEKDDYVYTLNDNKIDQMTLSPKREKAIKNLQQEKNVELSSKKEIAKISGVSISTVNSLCDIGVINRVKKIVGCDNDNYKDDQCYKYKEPELNDEQNAAAFELENSIIKNKFETFLLDGVTGSGKTEVYFKAAAKSIEMGKSVLILLPEIALTEQFLNKFKERFGTAPVLWHSGLTPAQRRETLKKIVSCQSKTKTKNKSADANEAPLVVIGARSSLFLPIDNLGLIVVDEEHDATYKQEDAVTYNARDMAVVRAKIESCSIVLSSATPSIESIINAENGKYKFLKLRNRFNKVLMPHIELIDMRKEKLKQGRWISIGLIKSIKENLENKKQTLLYLNRKGYAPVNICGECGSRVSCQFCSSYLVEHRKKAKMICHHCGYTTSKVNHCDDCGADNSFVACGPGVERVVEEVNALFPDARVCSLTSDSFSTYNGLKELLDDIHNGKYDIIVGTQVLAKGHHFKDLTLVGIIDGDISGADIVDIRSNERSYQLLQQVSGRAGREMGQRGKVFIQTYKPDSEVMQALISGDRFTFIEYEKLIRQYSNSPPFGRLTGVIISGPNKISVEMHAKRLKSLFPKVDDVEIIGPAPAQIEMLRGKYRWRLLIKHKKPNIQPVVKAWNDNNKPADKHIKVQIDVDPYSFV